jgi:hypothetical protein
MDEQIKQIRQTLGLMRSMIQCGESFTDSAMERYTTALENCDQLSAFQAAGEPRPDPSHLSAENARLKDQVAALENLEECVGMWCESCPVEVQEALHKLPWIYKVHYSHPFIEPDERMRRLTEREDAQQAIQQQGGENDGETN